MRHGLIRWREEELSRANVEARQDRMRAALRAEGLDGLVVYTNHVRSGAVTWLSGFTPYWSDALWLLPAAGDPVFFTALSKRVGTWVAANNPTSEIAHSPRPGELLGTRLAAAGMRRVGVLELDRLPDGLFAEIAGSADDADLIDASASYAALRGESDGAEARLVAQADAIARRAFAGVPPAPVRVGEVTEALELAVRLAGAEECYVAVAPDLADDARLARRKGAVALGARYAVRLSVAYNGTWIRRTETFARAAGGDDLAAARAWADDLARRLEPGPDLPGRLAETPLPAGMALDGFRMEAPVGSRPLQVVADGDTPPSRDFAYGVLTLSLSSDGGPVVLTRPIGSTGSGGAAEAA